MTSAQRVVQKFGGQSALADLLSKKQSTIQYWVKTGTIPAKWHRQLLDLAQERGIELYPGDLIDGADDMIVPEKPEELPVAQWEGVLTIGNVELPVYVLSDGRRVMSKTGATSALSGIRWGGNIGAYLGVEGLKGYLTENVDDYWIAFRLPSVAQLEKNVVGITAESFLEICTAYVSALNDGKLTTNRQMEIAAKAAVFLASCAKVGLVALIDEATRYQYEREEDALQFKLRLFLAEEMRKWESTFPMDLWTEFGRLTRYEGPVTSHRPKFWGRLVMDLIYGYLDSDVAEWLRKNNPEPRKGRNHHQWLNSQYGLRKLNEHIWMVIGLAKACHSMTELKMRMAELYGRQPVQYTMFLPPPGTGRGKQSGYQSDYSQLPLDMEDAED